jgi:hypothetical protein
MLTCCDFCVVGNVNKFVFEIERALKGDPLNILYMYADKEWKNLLRMSIRKPEKIAG